MALQRRRGDDGATSFSPVIPSLSPSSSSSLPPLGFLDLAAAVKPRRLRHGILPVMGAQPRWPRGPDSYGHSSPARSVPGPSCAAGVAPAPS